jgi:chemosensory pili system protein ChpA (sensor histidine kinase/response regulator)
MPTLAPAPSKSRKFSAARTVLIADSDVRMLDVMKRSLLLRGYEVETARGGVECLTALRHGGNRLVVLEFELAWGGGDGVLAMMQENARLARLPVVLTTQRFSAASMTGSVPSSVVSILEKPFSMEVLCNAIHAAVGGESSYRPKQSGSRVQSCGSSENEGLV